MQTLTDRHRLPATARALRFLSIRLRTREEAAPLLAAVNDLRTRLQDADEAWQQAREERVAASAELAYCDSLLDAAVLDLSRELNVLTKGRKDDPRRKRLFPMAPSVAVRDVASQAQDILVQTIITTLRSDAAFQTLIGYADRLEPLLKAVEEARDIRQKLYVPEGQAFGVRQQTLDESHRVYNLMHHRLTLLYTDDPALVESFFATLNERGSANEPNGEAEAEVVAQER